MPLDIFGRERIIEPPKKKVRRKVEQPIRRPVYCSENNDIKGWFQDNKPETLADVADLRKAMRTKKAVGKYNADSHEARTGRKMLRVLGPVSNVMIVSPEARKLFNQKLRNREVILEILRDQLANASKSADVERFSFQALEE